MMTRSHDEKIKRTHAEWLDAAGIHDDGLRSAFELCRRLHAHYGRTYYLATLFLPQSKRPFVNSLYGFARYADEIVDNGDPSTMADEFTQWCARALADLRRGHSEDPVCRALLHTMRVWDIPLEHVEAFLSSMLMDLTITEYRTFEDLREYMYGSAAVIGLQMVPILEPLDPSAFERAAALGEAFQLTNFLRDIAEDLRRGRVYLPMEDLDAFGVTRESMTAGVVDQRFRDLLKFEIDRTRRLYAFARGGIDLLAPSSRACIATAFTLYGGILDEIERADYRILDRRVAVSVAGRLKVAIPAYRSARRFRRAGIPASAGGERS
ncbi:phytoene/squalene synthase family protein [Lentzea flava]|uniref:Phytoene synthase n=1 Tax=Lentzea flava TaxID=103732 RepID=A0ABQ2VEK0_9PSEU|nr:phytoene/squalene synthase family protein [Lentzea flava]MCP2205040.1 phytoene synthase [Lentzea flava]GGU82985.1 phytoene synthase [Lentzea flava]